MPEIAPPLVISHDEESMATVEELLPSVVAPVEESVVKAPVPAVEAPILTKFAAPAPVTFQLASFRTRSEPLVLPIVIVPVDEPVPIFVAVDPDVLTFVVPVTFVVPSRFSVSRAEPMFTVSAVVLSVATLTVFPAVPVPTLMVFALLFVPRLTVPVVPESTVTAPVVPEVKAKALPAADVIEPVPAKPSAVAEVEMVSMEATPVKAPPVVTFRPPLEAIAKVPVVLPMVILLVPVPSETAPDPLTVKVPEACE